MQRGRQGLFGRRKREDREEAQREQGRRALFEELAQRPPNICPFLGLASSQTEYHDSFTREHRCYAFGDPAELSTEQQERVCLTRGYGNCPRYLRGVLVIPTEELEALRRPLAPVRPAASPTPPAPPPPPTRSTPGGAGGEGGARNRSLPILVGLVLLLAVGGAAGAMLLLGAPVANGPTPTPSPTGQPSILPSATVQATGSGQASPSTAPASQTPFPETPKPDATPIPGDKFIGYEVTVLEGENTLFQVDASGAVTGSVIAHYNRFSKAPVDRIEAPNGLLHWRTAQGFFAGLSYIHGQSGVFLIREVYQGTDGSLRYNVLPDSKT
jgi:hypothetical protein